MSHNFYSRYILPWLEKIDPERAHNTAVWLLHILERTPGGLALLARLSGNTNSLSQEPRLTISLEGLHFNSPLMVAAGWDKHGLCSRALHAMGFSAIEIGGVTLTPQPGHPRPRIFRVGPGVLINRCGFNSVGAHLLLRRLTRYRDRDFPLGINLGKNADIPLEQSAEHFATLLGLFRDAVDYYTLNVSSPNTQGLQNLQQPAHLADILQALPRNQKPLFLKISPDLSYAALDKIIDTAITHKVNGIIAVNTLLDTQVKAQYQAQNIQGGLSGNSGDYRARATAFCRYIYQQAHPQLKVIASGGVHNTYTFLEKITTGATVVQVLTALAYEGPGLAHQIKQETLAWMDREKIKHISDCVGREEYLESFGSYIKP